MKEILEAVNAMQSAGIIEGYAIGGAVGATFYLEPAATMDIDIFVALPPQPTALVTLTPLYEFLKTRGGRVEAEYIVLAGWPVQFLPAADGLEEEALRDAILTEVEGVPTRVLTAEHLAAIALRTGRAKDHSRLLQFLEQDALNHAKLHDILSRHKLTGKWEQFERRYRGDVT